MPQEAKTVILSDEAQKVGDIDPYTKAKILGLNADTLSRGLMVLVIAGIFIGLNWAVINLIEKAFTEDLAFLRAGGSFKPADRLITTNVFISLIGATVVQVGVAAITIVSYLFPKQSASEK